MTRRSTRVDFGDPAARRRLAAEMAGAKPRPAAARSSRAMAALVIFLGILSAALHGGAIRGSLANGRGIISGESLRAARPDGPSREVYDMRARRLIGAALVAAAAATSAHGADWLVPSKQYPTIQSAVNAAVDGDTVVLAAGVFTESVVTGNKALTIRGAGAAQTTWRAPVGNSCMPPQPDNTKPLTLSDIRFADFNMPSYPNAAVNVSWIAPHVIRRCAFTNCTFFALNVWGSGSLVEDCDFVGTTNGIAVNTNLSSSANPHVFRNCRFTDNRYGDSASAMDIYQSNLRLEGCTFTRNNFPIGNGFAVRAVASNLTVTNTKFCESSLSPILGGWTDGGGNAFTTSPCVPPCPADIVRDSAVNGADLAIILVAWGTSGSQYPGADLDGNRVVNGSDLAAVLAAWGPCPQ